MKLDVEGHEYEVLGGAIELMSRVEFKSVQFEFGEYTSERNQNFKKFYDLLNNLNFEIYRISKFGTTKITKYSPKLEIH